MTYHSTDFLYGRPVVTVQKVQISATINLKKYVKILVLLLMLKEETRSWSWSLEVQMASC